MKAQYRLFRRNGVYYAQDNFSSQQESLKTRDYDEATALLQAKNQSRASRSFALEIGLTYLRHANPKMATRTWKEAMEELALRGKPSSQERCKRELQSKAFDLIRHKKIVETNADDFKMILESAGAATNHYLRCLHNFALGNGWLAMPILPPKLWTKTVRKQKRAITVEEHQRIIAAETNAERRHYYEMLWHIGAAQTDCALLRADNINWQTRVLAYSLIDTPSARCAPSFYIATSHSFPTIPPVGSGIYWR